MPTGHSGRSSRLKAAVWKKASQVGDELLGEDGEELSPLGRRGGDRDGGGGCEQGKRRGVPGDRGRVGDGAEFGKLGRDAAEASCRAGLSGAGSPRRRRRTARGARKEVERQRRRERLLATDAPSISAWIAGGDDGAGAAAGAGCAEHRTARQGAAQEQLLAPDAPSTSAWIVGGDDGAGVAAGAGCAELQFMDRRRRRRHGLAVASESGSGSSAQTAGPTTLAKATSTTSSSAAGSCAWGSA